MISSKICFIIFILAIHPVQGYPGSWFLVYNLISTPPKMPRSTVGMRQYKSKNFRKIRLFRCSNYQDQDKIGSKVGLEIQARIRNRKKHQARTRREFWPLKAWDQEFQASLALLWPILLWKHVNVHYVNIPVFKQIT